MSRVTHLEIMKAAFVVSTRQFVLVHLYCFCRVLRGIPIVPRHLLRKTHSSEMRNELGKCLVAWTEDVASASLNLRDVTCSA